MKKITISLTVQELRILTQILNYALSAHELDKLRKEHLTIYLQLSCVYDFYAKLDKKNQEIAAFGFTPGKPVNVAMKRHEALAFYQLVNPDEGSESLLPAIPSTTESLILGIIGEIHKQFLV